MHVYLSYAGLEGLIWKTKDSLRPLHLPVRFCPCYCTLSLSTVSHVKTFNYGLPTPPTITKGSFTLHDLKIKYKPYVTTCTKNYAPYVIETSFEINIVLSLQV